MWPSRLVLQKNTFGYALYRPQRGTWGYRPNSFLKKCFWETPYCIVSEQLLPSLESPNTAIIMSEWTNVPRYPCWVKIIIKSSSDTCCLLFAWFKSLFPNWKNFKNSRWSSPVSSLLAARQAEEHKSDCLLRYRCTHSSMHCCTHVECQKLTNKYTDKKQTN